MPHRIGKNLIVARKRTQFRSSFLVEVAIVQAGERDLQHLGRQADINHHAVGIQIGPNEFEVDHVGRAPAHAVLEVRLKQLEAKYPGDVPLPPYWGGYVLSPAEIEFWQGRPNRLHDRFRYTNQTDGTWLIQRLAP